LPSDLASPLCEHCIEHQHHEALLWLRELGDALDLLLEFRCWAAPSWGWRFADQSFDSGAECAR
jgi:hypothetical protein